MHAVVDGGDVGVLQTADRDGQVQGGVQLLLGDLSGIDGEVGPIGGIAGGLLAAGGLLSGGSALAAGGALGGVAAAAAGGKQAHQHGGRKDGRNDFPFLHFVFSSLQLISFPSLQNGRLPGADRIVRPYARRRGLLILCHNISLVLSIIIFLNLSIQSQ